MELPAIHIPQIVFPFEIPLMLHPIVDHFVIALPIIVFILEIINLVMKKRALGITSFFLLLLTVVISVVAYFTGSVDAKEAYPLLSEMAQEELREHKLLGTYVMLGSAVLLAFKFLSALLQRGLMKALYLLVFVLFIAMLVKQGKDGGELVYKYGVNVQSVQDLSSEIDDLKEEVEDLEAKIAEKVKVPATPAVVAPKEEAATTPVVSTEKSVEDESKSIASEVVAKVVDQNHSVASVVAPHVESVVEKVSQPMETLDNVVELNTSH